jgi:hypothetical protein
MDKFLLVTILVLFAGCSQDQKRFSSVEIGMSSKEVLRYAGEPDKKQDIGIADLWVYENADRTVVLRKDTVYDIITSANARIDSVKITLDKIGDRIERKTEKAGEHIKGQAEKAGEKVDSIGKRIKNRSDTVLKN